jgi:hypothetical protein
MTDAFRKDGDTVDTEVARVVVEELGLELGLDVADTTTRDRPCRSGVGDGVGDGLESVAVPSG